MQKDEHVATVRAIEEYSETPPQRIPPPPDDQPPTTCPQRQTKTSTFKDISFGPNSTLNKQKDQFSNLHENRNGRISSTNQLLFIIFLPNYSTQLALQNTLDI